MANEIVKLDGDGGLRANLLFLYPVVAPTYPIDGGTYQVVATPSAGLPSMAVQILTAAEKADLDAGAMAFEIVQMDIDDAKNPADLLAAAQALYATRKSIFIDRLNRKYNRAGQRFSGV